MEGRKFEGIWIPADLWLRKDLSVYEKILYLEIKSLDKEFGCIASNKRLAEILQLKPNTISVQIKNLAEKGLINIRYDDYTTFDGRVITILKDYSTPSPRSIPPSPRSKGASSRSKAPSPKSIHSNNISNKNSNSNNTNVLFAESNNSASIELSVKSPKSRKPTVRERMIEVWLKEIHVGWTFTAVHGKQINELEKKIIAILNLYNNIITDDRIVEFFKAMCMGLPDWYKDKDLLIINSKFNEIITEIKNKNNGQSTATNTKQQTTYSSTKSFVESL